MEHYLICILRSALNEKDHAVISEFLNTLYPKSFQCQFAAEFDKFLAILMKPISKYVAVLNISEINENIVWKSLNEGANILEIIEENFTGRDSAFELDSQDSSDYISAQLHSLADQLPACGSYRLDILLSSDVLRELSLNKEPALAGAFIRLTKWHSAHFSIFEQKEFDSEKLNEWCEVINAQVLCIERKVNFGPCLWRGSVQFCSSDAKNDVYKGFELKLQSDESNYNTFTAKNIKSENEIVEFMVLSSKLQVIDEVSFTSIPPYFISPVIFKLHLNKPNILNENSSNVIEYLLRNEKIAFIAKLGYAELKVKSKPERKYCSNRWQKVAFSGEIKDSECYVSSFENFITFAITKSVNSDNIVAYLMRDPSSLDASFHFRIINHRIFFSKNDKISEGQKNINVPLVSDSVCQTILHEYSKLFMDSKNGLCNSKSDVDFSSVLGITQNSSSFSQFGNTCSLKLSFEEIDPSNWPERIQLLHKKMEEEKECFSANTLAVQNLKLPQQSYSLTSMSIIENFLPSGEPKNLENLEDIYSINNSDHLVTCNLKDVLQLHWPEIMNCIYHDLYYNFSNQTEDKESLGNQLVNLYVKQETASTCSNQQLTQNFQIVVSGKTSSPSKAFLGPSSRSTHILNDKSNIKTPRKNTLRDLITKKILSTSVPQNKNSGDSKNLPLEPSKRNLNHKNSVPVRSSPRKKSTVDYKYPSSNRNNISLKNNKTVESNKMPDILRKKMRYAVAKALEDNGINSTHSMYQPCGAKLLTICRTFLDDLKLKKGKTSEYLQKIADAHVKQVIEFYKD